MKYMSLQKIDLSCTSLNISAVNDAAYCESGLNTGKNNDLYKTVYQGSLNTENQTHFITIRKSTLRASI